VLLRLSNYLALFPYVLAPSTIPTTSVSDPTTPTSRTTTLNKTGAIQNQRGFVLATELKTDFVHGTKFKQVSLFQTKWFGTAPFFPMYMHERHVCEDGFDVLFNHIHGSVDYHLRVNKQKYAF
jgi:hypothetical protein